MAEWSKNDLAFLQMPKHIASSGLSVSIRCYLRNFLKFLFVANYERNFSVLVFLKSLLIIPNGKTIRNRRKKRRKRRGERNQCETSKPKE
jgi:hypothetical protein